MADFMAGGRTMKHSAVPWRVPVRRFFFARRAMSGVRDYIAADLPAGRASVHIQMHRLPAMNSASPLAQSGNE